MNKLKEYFKYVVRNGYYIPGIIFLGFIILATKDQVYSMVTLASLFLLVLIIGTIVDFKRGV